MCSTAVPRYIGRSVDGQAGRVEYYCNLLETADTDIDMDMDM